MSGPKNGKCPSCVVFNVDAISEFKEVRTVVRTGLRGRGRTTMSQYGLWSCLKCDTVVYRPTWTEEGAE